MFCKKCGHERANGEKFCPICGTPFPVEEDTKDENILAKIEVSPLQKDSEEKKPSEPVVQYCKKCGTKQENGMKFCPVCGEPYLDENGKPYLKGRQKDIADAKEKVKSTISDLSDKGKNIAGNIGEKISTATSEGQKQVKEKVLPQISQVVTQAKETDWEEQAKNGKEKANAFLNDSAKTTKWAKITAVAATVLFFVINGFNSIWLWYVILIIMLLIAFLPQKGQSEAEVAAKHKKIFIATACLAGCLIFLRHIGAGDLSSSDSDSDDSSTGLFHEESAMDKFKSTITSASYTTPIYMKTIYGGWYARPQETDDRSEANDFSYNWTLVFYPDDDNNTGSASLIPFTLDNTGYSTTAELNFQYEIEGDMINLYNGKHVIGGGSTDDIHLQVEDDGDDVKLVGHFRDRQREFKKSNISVNRDPHHSVR